MIYPRSQCLPRMATDPTPDLEQKCPRLRTQGELRPKGFHRLLIKCDLSVRHDDGTEIPSQDGHTSVADSETEVPEQDENK